MSATNDSMQKSFPKVSQQKHIVNANSIALLSELHFMAPTSLLLAHQWRASARSSAPQSDSSSPM